MRQKRIQDNHVKQHVFIIQAFLAFFLAQYWFFYTLDFGGLGGAVSQF